MSVDDKRRRDLELLRKSRRALDEGELVDRNAEEAPSRDRSAPAPPQAAADDGETMMYRGKVVKKPGGGAGSRIPGASGSGARAGQFRGASTQKSGGKGSGDVRAILERLNGLYKDGLITKTEYDRKRQQILDRL